MEPKNLTVEEIRLLESLSSLPQKMLAVHGISNLTEFVLHELCDQGCFNLDKAAYLIDNPDFDCLKGIAGYSKSECSNLSDVWNQPDKFSEHMKCSNFNNIVRQIHESSVFKSGKNYESTVNELAKNLNLDKAVYYSWPMKHNNHGILIIQRPNNNLSSFDQHILKGLSFLAFCPVF
ncbi:hypothetical protein M1446_02325 [Candidatus Dependentiae bacterium]|nr:hypothetical protein [Candidatus Dependentiae bacterium]